MDKRAATDSRRIIIVGAGIGGLAAAWALTRRGHRVTVLEQGAIPNPLSSSWDEHRIIRHAYGAMHGYALMMPAAFAAWRTLWADLGAEHYAPAPATYCLRVPSDWYRDVSRSLDALGVGYRDIPLDIVAARLPMVNREGLFRVVETDGAGLLYADRIVSGLADWLRRNGAVLVEGVRVDRLDAEHAVAWSGSRAWSGDHLVLAAGAWTERLIGPQPERLRPSVQTVAYLDPPADLVAAWQTAPLLLNRLALPSGGAYVLPPRPGRRLKIGDYDHTFEGDPDAPRTPRPEHVERLMAAGAAALDGFASYRLVETRACFYTVSRDESFVLRPLAPRSWLLSACSGHGFKLGALVGEAVADAVDGERSPAEIADRVGGRITSGAAAAAAASRAAIRSTDRS